MPAGRVEVVVKYVELDMHAASGYDSIVHPQHEEPPDPCGFQFIMCGKQFLKVVGGMFQMSM